LLIAAADPQEDGQRYEGDTTDTYSGGTKNRTDDGWRDSASSKTDLIILSTVGVSDLNDAGDVL